MPKIRISKIFAFICSFVTCGINFYIFAEVIQNLNPNFRFFYSAFALIGIYVMWKILYPYLSFAFNFDA